MATLLSEIRRLKADLLSAGGVTIDTPVPPPEAADAFPVAARTVVQPDGDLLFFVGDAYFVDPDVRQLHAARVSAWFTDLERRVRATGVALRGAALTLMSLVFVFTRQAFDSSTVSGLFVLAIATALGFLLQAGVRLAVGYDIRRRGRSPSAGD